MEPMEAGDRWGPQKYTAIDLMEISIVSIPANVDAAVIQRQANSMVHREGRPLSGDTVGKLQNALASINDARGTIGGLLETSQSEERSSGISRSQRQADARRLRQIGLEHDRSARQMEAENLRGIDGAELPKHVRIAQAERLRRCP
jgi:hypothetical protein